MRRIYFDTEFTGLKKDTAFFLTVYHKQTRRMTANAIEKMVKNEYIREK